MTSPWPRSSSLKRRKGLMRHRGMRIGPSIQHGPLDRLFSQYIRARDKICQRCGRAGGRLEAAHMFSRAKQSVRYDPDNCYALCGGPSSVSCHRYFDLHTTEKMAWLKARLGEQRFELLHLRAVTPRKPDRTGILLWLRKELAGVA